MAAPVGLDRKQVVDAAVDILRDTGRLDAVALREVAERLGVRIQSLYAHVDGSEGLRRELALRALDALAERLTIAAIGRAGTDAVQAIARAYLAFAAEEPGLYEASLQPPGDNADLRAAMDTVMRPLNLVFASFGFDEATAIHWYRIVFASVHGLAFMRRDALITLPADFDETVARLIAGLVRLIEDEVAAPKVARPRRRR